jgi:hypothetical protein
MNTEHARREHRRLPRERVNVVNVVEDTQGERLGLIVFYYLLTKKYIYISTLYLHPTGLTDRHPPRLATFTRSLRSPIGSIFTRGLLGRKGGRVCSSACPSPATWLRRPEVPRTKHAAPMGDGALRDGWPTGQGEVRWVLGLGPPRAVVTMADSVDARSSGSG